MMRRHPLDLVSFAFGAAFLAAGSLLLSNRLDLLADLRWAVPALLIVVALAMFASLRVGSGPAPVDRTAPRLDDVRPPGIGD
jgi:hypothetical protein